MRRTKINGNDDAEQEEESPASSLMFCFCFCFYSPPPQVSREIVYYYKRTTRLRLGV